MTAPSEEQPILIENFFRKGHYFDENSETIVERRPVSGREVWLDINMIPSTPPAQTPFPGTVSGAVSGISDVALTAVPGSDTVFESTAGEFLDMVPTSVDAGGESYQPTLRDSNGRVVEYDPAVWTADGLREVVEFKYGIPSGFTPPFTIDYWRYVGQTAGGANVTLANLGTDADGDLVADGAGPSLELLGIAAGPNITLSRTATDITISAAGGANVTLATAVGFTGQDLVVDGVGPDLEIRGVAAGMGLTATSDATDVTISYDSTKVLSDAGAGTFGLVVGDTMPNLSVKTFNAGTGISIGDAANILTITNDSPASAISLADGGSGESLVADASANPNFLTKGLAAGTGISLSSNATDVTIENSSPASAISLAGTGVGDESLVAGTSVNPNFLTKDLVAGTGVSFSSTATTVTITNDSPASAISLADGGTGESLVADASANPNFLTKGLVAGTGISLSSDATDVTIENSSPASAISLAGTGTGDETLVAGTSANPNFLTKDLVAGTGISLSSNATEITIENSSPASAISLADGGTGESLVADASANPNFLTKGLAAGTGISLSSNATDITIENDSPASAISLADGGTGETLVADASANPNFLTKGLAAGTGISLSSNATDVTIENSSPASAISLAGTGAGDESLVAGTSANPNFLTKDLVAGTGVSFSSTATTVTITNDSPASNVSLTDAGTIGGHLSLVDDGIGPSLSVVGLSAGTGITLAATGSTDITITNDSPASAISLADGGSGESLVADASANPNFLTKGLAAGTGISLSSNATDVTIENSSPASAISLAGTGAGDESLVAGTSVNPNFLTKDLVAGTGVSFSSTATTVTITNDSPASSVLLTDAGTIGGHLSLVDDGIGPSLSVVGLSAGTGITLAATGSTDITITNDSPATSVTLTTVVGSTGEDLVADGVGPDLEIRGVAAGTGLTATSDATDVTISYDTTDVLSDAGAGTFGLVVGQKMPNLSVKSINAGSGITILDAADTLTIINSSPASTVSLADAGTIGGHLSLVDDGIGPILSVVGLSAGTGITLAATGSTDITITNDSPASAISLADGGTGETLVAGASANPNFLTKGLIAGTGISLSSNATDVTIENSSPASAISLADGGTGETLIADASANPNFLTKGLVAGTGITLSSNLTDVTISVTASASGATWVFQDVQPPSTQGGASVVGAQVRVLNTPQSSGGGDVQLAVAPAGPNQLLFQPGTYRIRATAPAFSVGEHQASLIDVTGGGSVILLSGTSETTSNFGFAGLSNTTRSLIAGVTTIEAANTIVEIQHFTQTAQGVNGLGNAVAGTDVAGNLLGEIYTEIEITRLS